VVPDDGTPGLSDAAVAAAGPGASLLSTTAFARPAGAGPAAVDVAGADAATFARVGRPDDLAADEVLVDRDNGPGWVPGTAVTLVFRDGATVSLRVAAVLDDAPAPVLMRRDVVRAHDPNALTSIVYVGTTGARAVPGARVLTPHEYGVSVDAGEAELVRIFLALLLIVGTGYTGIAIANTLLMSAAGRRREFAVLRLSGASVGQVLRTVTAETVIVVGIGATLGLGVAVAGLQGMRTGLAEEVGFAPALSVPWATVALIVGVCLALAVPASVWPAWRAVRGAPAR
jgi:putative ABC transport system permease protein